MRRFVFVLACLAALTVPVTVLASGGESGFNGVVRTLEVKYHVHANRIPFLGLISFVMGKNAEYGVSNLHVAEFEDFRDAMDGEELNSMVEQKLGPQWQRVIRETSRFGQDQTLIFMHPEGRRMGLFVLDASGHELDVVQVSVDGEHLNEKIGQYQHHSHRQDEDD
ncbi:hypothetical protein DYQ86_08030 [Acidobacteria bacterium AB60]|nr:hypothetical protein DYQ86_08030 [Acidobacteria bacterium AB60]